VYRWDAGENEIDPEAETEDKAVANIHYGNDAGCFHEDIPIIESQKQLD
jgi:hypothetical protein